MSPAGLNREFEKAVQARAWHTTRRPGFTDKDTPQYSVRVQSGPLLELALMCNPDFASKLKSSNLQINRYDPVANTFRGHADSKNEAPSRGYIWGTFKGGVLKIHQPDGIRSIRSLSQWFAFDGRHFHEMTPVTDGVRFSAILFDRPKQDGQNTGSAIPGS